MSLILGFFFSWWFLAGCATGVVLGLLPWGASCLAARIRARRAEAPAAEPAKLPRRRIPIDPGTRDARDAQLDGVLAEIARTGPTGWYLAARLFAYEAQLSDLLELALELDENVPVHGPEDDNADA